MLMQAPKPVDEAWLSEIEEKMERDGYIDLDDPEQRRVFLKDRTHFKYRENKATPEAKAKAASENEKALSNLETGKAKLTLPNTRQRAIEKAAQISKKPDLPAGRLKTETPKASKTPYKPLESAKATNAPKAEVKATERENKHSPERAMTAGLDVKEKQGLLLERAWLKFKLGGMDLDVLIAEINNIKKAMLVEAFFQFEAVAKANNTTIEQIVKAGKRHG